MNPFALMESQVVQRLPNFFKRRVSLYRVAVEGTGGLDKSPLASGPYRVFFGAQLISSAGGAVAPIALAFAILQIGGRGSGIAVVLGSEFVVYMVLLPVAGVIADRTAGVGVLVTSQAIAAGFQLAEAILIISGAARVWSLAVVAAGGAGGAALFTPAGRRVLPRLVPAGQLNRANALSQAARHGIATIGPVAGGVLVAAVGPGWGIAWDSATFVIAGALFSRLPRPAAPPEHHGQRRDRTWASELTGGVRAFTSLTWLWTTTLADCLAGGAFSAAMLIGPLYARQHLHGAISWARSRVVSPRVPHSAASRPPPGPREDPASSSALGQPPCAWDRRRWPPGCPCR